MRLFFALSLRFSAGLIAAVLFLAVGTTRASDDITWCSCGQPTSCACGDGWSATPYGEGEIGEGMDAPDATGAVPATPPAGGFAQEYGGGSRFVATSAPASLADSGVAYIDTAIVGTHVRFRFDAAYDFDNPDRAEYFYSTWEAFGGQTDAATIGPNRSIDAQFFKLYYEQALTQNFSAFVEGAAVLNDPSGIMAVNGNPPMDGPGPNTQGIGDMIAGVKLLLWDNGDELLTFQLTNYIPTGDEDKWLTAGHYSIEPALLYFNRLNNRWILEAEIRDWIPIGGAETPGTGEPYAGNILRYGAGLSYNLVNGYDWWVRPVTEVVGWSVLEGQKFEFAPDGTQIGPIDADGDAIVNIKSGVRIGRQGGTGSVYFGYGTAITDEAWYEDIFRFEYRRWF